MRGCVATTPCPRCKAEPGQSCRSMRWLPYLLELLLFGERGALHDERIAAYERYLRGY